MNPTTCTPTVAAVEPLRTRLDDPMKTFTFKTTLKPGIVAPVDRTFEDQYEGESIETALDAWDEDLHRYGLTRDNVSVEIKSL